MVRHNGPPSRCAIFRIMDVDRNEPSLAPSNYAAYATLANYTCRALHRAAVDTPGWKPRLFYGTFSGGYVSAGPPILDGSLPILKEQLAGSGLALEDCVAAVTYHACKIVDAFWILSCVPPR